MTTYVAAEGSRRAGGSDPISDRKQLRTDNHLELRENYRDFVSLKTLKNRI